MRAEPATDTPSAEYVEAKVRSLFGKLAPAYDFGNSLITFGFHRAWKRCLLLDSGKLRASARVLDACAGTGDLAILAKKICPSAHVTGIDFSPPMLEVARRRAEKLPPDERPEFIEGDVTDLSMFEVGTFDLITMGFGLRNVSRKEKALREFARVLAPGGVLSMLDLAKPFSPVLGFVMFVYLRIVMPVFSLIYRKNAKEYLWLHESLQMYPDVEALTGELLDAGFAEVSVKRLGLGAVAIHRAVLPDKEQSTQA